MVCVFLYIKSHNHCTKNISEHRRSHHIKMISGGPERKVIYVEPQPMVGLTID